MCWWEEGGQHRVSTQRGGDRVCAGLQNGDGALQSLADIQLRLRGDRARAVLGSVWGLGGNTGGLVVDGREGQG